MDLEEDQPVQDGELFKVHYYLHQERKRGAQARRMKELEKLTMYVDFNHLARFRFYQIIQKLRSIPTC